MTLPKQVTYNPEDKLVAISNVTMLHGFIKYRSISAHKRIVTEQIKQENGRVTEKFFVDGNLLAEERNLTTYMAGISWYARHKSDRVYVMHDAFAEYCKDSEWYVVPRDDKARYYRWGLQKGSNYG